MKGSIARRDTARRKMEKRIENGLCYSCGGKKEQEEKGRCNKCIERYNGYAKKHNKKRKGGYWKVKK